MSYYWFIEGVVMAIILPHPIRRFIRAWRHVRDYEPYPTGHDDPQFLPGGKYYDAAQPTGRKASPDSSSSGADNGHS